MPKTKEEIKKYQKEYRLKNKEKALDYNKNYYKEHKEKAIENSKKQRQTYKGKKCNILSNWKERGLIDDNYDKIYEIYLNTQICDNCDIELNNGTGTKKHMDHDHSNGLFRNILCQTCNFLRF